MTIETLEAKVDAFIAKAEAEAKTVSKTTWIIGIAAFLIGVIIGRLV